MKKQPVVSLRGELYQFLAYGFTFSLIMLVVFLVIWVLSV